MTDIGDRPGRIMLPCQVLYADGLGLETATQMYLTSSAIVRIYWVSTVTLRT
jgi:hypothetical protein